MAVQLQDLLWGTLAELRYRTGAAADPRPAERSARAGDASGAAVVLGAAARGADLRACRSRTSLAERRAPAPPRSEPVTATPVSAGLGHAVRPQRPVRLPHHAGPRADRTSSATRTLDGVAFAPDDPRWPTT